jgi:hypothetical protein
MKETSQVKSYAFAVQEDERFRGVPTRWTFWLVSNDMDGNVRNEVRQADLLEGVLWESQDHRNRILVKTWAQILHDCRTRLKVFQNELNHNVDRDASLAYLNETYARILHGGPADESPTEDETPDEESQSAEGATSMLQ